MFKINESIIVIQAEATSPNRTNVVFWSHDRGTAKLRMKLVRKNDIPQSLPEGTTVPIRLMFKSATAEGGYGKHDYLATVEDPVNGIVSIVLEDNILGYVGTVEGSVYIDFPDDRSLDTAGRFTFDIKRSPIDDSTPELEDYYFNGFSQTIDKIEKILADGKQEIEQKIAESETQIDAKLKDTNDKITKANQDVATLNTNIDKANDRIDQTNQQIGEVLSGANEFRTDIDTLKINKADKIDVNQALNQVNDRISNFPKGNPSGVYTTLADLKTAFPNGNSNIYVVSADNKWYYWNGTTWTAGGVYNEKAIGDKQLKTNMYDDGSVTREKINYFRPAFSNIFDLSMLIPDEHYDIAGALKKKGDADYVANFGRTPLLKCTPGDTIYKNTKFGTNEGQSLTIIVFFDDQYGNNFVSGSNFTVGNVSSAVGSVVVPENAHYFSMAVYQLADLANAVMTINETIGYEDPLLSLSHKQLIESFGLPRSTAYLIPATGFSDWEIKIDFDEGKLYFSKYAMFANFGSGFGWMWGTGVNLEQDVTFTFDEIMSLANAETLSMLDYTYVFIKRDNVTTGKTKFKFLIGSYFNAQESNLVKGYAYLGMFMRAQRKAYFPNTRVAIVSKTEVTDAKKISILGDSISTFTGWIPSGNKAFYPTGFLTNVETTWWKQLIDQSDGKLELLVNNSWSGSRVTTTTGVEQAGVTRATLLHNDISDPDLIITYMGINDFNNGVDQGTFDGSTSPTFTDTATFREAYTLMLKNMTQRYPKAKIYCCTLPFNARGGFPRINGKGVLLDSFNGDIKRLSKLFGCEVIELDRIGLNENNTSLFLGDGLHPNDLGMDLITEMMKKAIYL
ncbi:hypothetical protein CKY08_00325 [Enterococcus faecium]|uniref:GDSL-type esterase/lipase family protein n=1 Tax=Enterococcus faecium TaxID=1352 RepID=UPI000BBB92CB|nr:GDSL-type esterase/lipase family protein [Enterococcus faecium]PCE10078.1 hypothetical protein CKY08_00325 [Enterococcus faecium]